MYRNIFDTHSHYADSAFDGDRDELLAALPDKGVRFAALAGSSMQDSAENVALAQKYGYIYAAVGVHPESVDETPSDYREKLTELVKSSEKVRAIGEIGLDYHYENYDRDKQILFFRQQLELARELSLPVIVHSRNASEDTLDILKEYRPAGVVHCFSGSAEVAREVIKLGMYIFTEMKKTILTALLLFAAAAVFAQSEYNFQRRSLFEKLPVTSKDIVFLGNSITDGGEWNELLANPRVKNRGISGDRSSWMLDRLDPIVGGQPRKLFLLIGTNDLAAGTPAAEVVANVRKIVERFQSESPRTKLYVQSVFPVNDSFKKYAAKHGRHDADIVAVNKGLQALCAEKGIVYIDLWTLLADKNGKLRADLTNDGLHLMGEGYIVWRDAVLPYVK